VELLGGDLTPPSAGTAFECLLRSDIAEILNLANERARVINNPRHSNGHGNLIANHRMEEEHFHLPAIWPEHGVLGTQLGPNKNGKKW